MTGLLWSILSPGGHVSKWTGNVSYWLFYIHHALYTNVSILFSDRGLPLIITYAPSGRGGGQVSHRFQLRITCKKQGGVQIACSIAYIFNGRPHLLHLKLIINFGRRVSSVVIQIH